MNAEEFDLGPSKWVWRALVTLTVAVVVVVLIVGFTAASKLSNIQDLQKHGDCRAQVESEFFTGVADALNAPPAPNPARQLAVDEIKTAADKLHRLEKVCP